MTFEQDPTTYDNFMCPQTLLETAPQMPLRVVNPANHPITLYKNQKLGTVEIAKRVHSIQMPKNTNTKSTPDKDPITSLDLEDSQMT